MGIELGIMDYKSAALSTGPPSTNNKIDPFPKVDVDIPEQKILLMLCPKCDYGDRQTPSAKLNGKKSQKNFSLIRKGILFRISRLQRIGF